MTTYRSVGRVKPWRWWRFKWRSPTSRASSRGDRMRNDPMLVLRNFRQLVIQDWRSSMVILGLFWLGFKLMVVWRTWSVSTHWDRSKSDDKKNVNVFPLGFWATYKEIWTLIYCSFLNHTNKTSSCISLRSVVCETWGLFSHLFYFVIFKTRFFNPTRTKPQGTLVRCCLFGMIRLSKNYFFGVAVQRHIRNYILPRSRYIQRASYLAFMTVFLIMNGKFKSFHCKVLRLAFVLLSTPTVFQRTRHFSLLFSTTCTITKNNLINHQNVPLYRICIHSNRDQWWDARWNGNRSMFAYLKHQTRWGQD